MTFFRDQNGRRVIVISVGKWNPDKVSLHDIFLNLYAVLEIISLEPKTQESNAPIC
jgi:hypothetical protein